MESILFDKNYPDYYLKFGTKPGKSQIFSGFVPGCLYDVPETFQK